VSPISRPTGHTSRADLNAALRPARESAHAYGEFVGQENYMTAPEILALARAAGLGSETTMLELCCGVGGVALFLAEQTGCRVVGVDLEDHAVRLARDLALERGLGRQAHFLVGDAAALPLRGEVDAALLLETMISIQDKPRVLGEIRKRLRPGGRLALTLEEGAPFTDAEQRRLPGGDCAWLVEEGQFLRMLEAAGYRLLLCEDHTGDHAVLAARLAAALHEHRASISSALGAAAWQAALVSAECWHDWLARRRARKLALVAERPGPAG
jgi:SAM-dependent methyltransferase